MGEEARGWLEEEAVWRRLGGGWRRLEAGWRRLEAGWRRLGGGGWVEGRGGTNRVSTQERCRSQQLSLTVTIMEELGCCYPLVNGEI